MLVAGAQSDFWLVKLGSILLVFTPALVMCVFGWVQISVMWKARQARLKALRQQAKADPAGNDVEGHMPHLHLHGAERDLEAGLVRY